MNIYVGNLSYKVSEDDLKALFTGFGEIAGVNIVTERFSGQSKGFGFVEMPNNREADKAIKALNGSRLMDQIIRVNQAKPPGKRPQHRTRY